MNNLPKCAQCGIEKHDRICVNHDGAGPENCPTEIHQELLESSKHFYDNQQNREFARKASVQESEGYIHDYGKLKAVKCRIEELIEFSHKNNFKKLGLAFCSGFITEAKILSEILIAQGFELVSVVCKAGATDKEYIGITEEEKINPGHIETMCNPVGQATILNHAETDFNIMMGLCIGHDSLFLKNVDAFTTVLAVKDRLLGHNPLAALYTSNSYYRRLKQKTSS